MGISDRISRRAGHHGRATQQTCVTRRCGSPAKGFSSLSAARGLSERFQRVSGKDSDTENGDDKRNRPEHELCLN